MANVGRSVENGRGCKNFIKAVDEDEMHETELHGFSDARSLANGANFYLHSLWKSVLIEVNLIFFIHRVALIKTITIPRLKLLDLLLSRLIDSLKTLKKES